MTIKAIETHYKGYRFRSRLEARWAVFFDACGVKWDYELEGFELQSGRYLPDFWLSAEEAFVEIKPTVFRPELAYEFIPREILLASELRRKTHRSVYIFYGDPVEALAPGYPGMVSARIADDDNLSFLYLTDYETAAIKARQARFEHGEAGA